MRFPHHDLVEQDLPPTAWFEVHPENYFGVGVVAEVLASIRGNYPISLHAVGLSLGSAQGLDLDHLGALKALCDRIEPGLVSDHLSWSAADGAFAPDLLPLPYSEEALSIFADNLLRAQDALERPLLVENPSVYLDLGRQAFSEGAFLSALVERTGCGVLLDINNVVVTASNLGQSAEARLDDILAHVPAAAIGEIHLAGHTVEALGDGLAICVDDHGSEVGPQTWSLFTRAIERLGPRPTLIEWDTRIPAFEILQSQAARAQAAMDSISKDRCDSAAA